MTVKTCRYWLAGIWLVGTGLLLFITIMRTAQGGGSATSPTMWRWLLPNLTPFITLVVTTVFAIHTNAATLRENAVPVDRFIFFTAAGISVFYLAAMTLMLLSVAWNPTQNFSETLKDTSIWMTPLQGVVSVALGFFFVKPKRA